MKYILLAAATVSVFVLASWWRSRGGDQATSTSPQQLSITDLSEGEKHIYDLLREVQGHAILTEKFVRVAGDVKVQLTFDTNKTTVSTMDINLTNLARKQTGEGSSDGAIKRLFTF